MYSNLAINTSRVGSFNNRPSSFKKGVNPSFGDLRPSARFFIEAKLKEVDPKTLIEGQRLLKKLCEITNGGVNVAAKQDGTILVGRNYVFYTKENGVLGFINRMIELAVEQN